MSTIAAVLVILLPFPANNGINYYPGCFLVDKEHSVSANMELI